MKEIESSALRAVGKVLGIGGLPGNAMFDDSVLQQVLDVSGLVRRAGSPYPGMGLFGLAFTLDHLSGQNLACQWDPYGSQGSTAGMAFGDLWENPVQQDMDVWVVGPIRLYVQNSAVYTGSGTEGASLRIQTHQDYVGPYFGTGQTSILDLGLWNNTTGAAGTSRGVLGTDLSTITQFPRATRIGRGDVVQFQSYAATAADLGEVRVTARVGLFPAGLGQDAI